MRLLCRGHSKPLETSSKVSNTLDTELHLTTNPLKHQLETCSQLKTDTEAWKPSPRNGISTFTTNWGSASIPAESVGMEARTADGKHPCSTSFPRLRRRPSRDNAALLFVAIQKLLGSCFSFPVSQHPLSWDRCGQTWARVDAAEAAKHRVFSTGLVEPESRVNTGLMESSTTNSHQEAVISSLNVTVLSS